MNQGKRSVYHDQFGDKHNSLFRPGPNSNLNACVGRNGGPADFSRMAGGFFEAGKRLVESLKISNGRVDLLIYPLVFNYRHGVEAALKYLGKQLPFLFGENEEVQFTHGLLDNCGKVRGYLERWPAVDRESEKAGIEFVHQRLEELVEIDPKGECFRYPEAKDGNPYLQDTSLINIEVFGQQMEQVVAILVEWIYLSDSCTT